MTHILFEMEVLNDKRIIDITVVGPEVTIRYEMPEPETEDSSDTNYDPDIHGYPDEIYEERDRKNSEPDDY